MSDFSSSREATQPGAIKAGECPHCGALFIAPDAGAGRLACPACDAVVDVAEARIRTLGMARVVADETKPAATPESVESPESDPLPNEYDEPMPPRPAVEELPVADSQPISDLGTLLGAVGRGVRDARRDGVIEAPASEPRLDVPSDGPRPLSEALGLTPPTREPVLPAAEDSEAAAPPAEEPAAPTVSPYGDVTVALPNFELDRTLGEASPLAESPGPGLVDLDFDAEPVAASDTEETPTDAEEPPPFLNRSRADDEEEPVGWAPPVVDEPKSRGWVAPLLATTALAVIATPLAYWGWNNFQAAPDVRSVAELTPQGENLRENRRALLDEAAEDSGVDEPLAFIADDAPAIGEQAAAETDSVGEATVVDVGAVEPASFDESTEVYGDRYATPASYADEPSNEIAPETEAVPEPVDAFEPAVDSVESLAGDSPIVDAPLYDVDTLREAIALAADAGPAFVEGDLEDDASAAAMGQNYARLCYLAQVLTLLDTGTFDLAMSTVQLEATDIYRKMFRDSGARADARQIASHWIAWGGRPHGGVFFAGDLIDAGRAGDVFEYRFPLAEGDDVYVVTNEKLDPKRFKLYRAAEIGVIGVVVDDATNQIPGYRGEQSRVVWARKTLPLKAVDN